MAASWGADQAEGITMVLCQLGGPLSMEGQAPMRMARKPHDPVSTDGNWFIWSVVMSRAQALLCPVSHTAQHVHRG